MNPLWIEYMYILLSFEPFPYCDVRTSMKSEEKEYIELILSNSYNAFSHSQYNCYHDLFVGFIANHSQANFGWLKNWKAQYHDGKSKDKRYYPELFKKICFYLIISHDMSNSDFYKAVGLKNNAINDWHVSPQYRRRSKLQFDIAVIKGNLRVRTKEREYTKLPLVRNGLKQAYIMNIVQNMYFEWCRQYAEQENFKAYKMHDKPIFVDVFTGTGTVAANINIPSAFKVLNDFDPNIVCMIYVILYHRNDVAKRLCEFHNSYVSKGEVPAGGYARYTEEKYVEDFFTSDYDKYKGKIKGEYHKNFILSARNLFNYCKYYLKNASLKVKLFERENAKSSIHNMIEIAACSLYYMSFKGNSKTNDADINGVDCDGYKKYMIEILKCKLENYSDNDSFEVQAKILMREKAIDVSSILKFPYWKKRLRNSIIASFSFEELFSDDISDAVSSVENTAKNEKCTMEDVFYYLDSPYFLTKQYMVKFADCKHKLMLDCLRGSNFKWIFSMQYHKKSYKNKGAVGRGKIKIKDYLTYYEGFLHELKQNGKVYEIGEKNDGAMRNELFVVLFDYQSIKNKFNQVSKPEGQEMLIANFDSSAVISYGCEYVQLPFITFLECVKADMDYAEMVNLAYELRREELIKLHGLNI